ncbi:MAG: nucleotidyltransferase domain-containing protein [Candidatus Rokuibacteriota bacterium]
MSPEIRFILDCLRPLEVRAAPAPSRPLNWDVVLTFAQAEGLAPALGVALSPNASVRMPGAVRKGLRRHLGAATARHLILRRELGRILQAFARAAVPVIPLKGLVLAETLYPDPVVRPSSDLDLLVRPEAVVAVDGLLQRLGYHRLADAHSWDFDLAYDRATLYAGPGGVHVDLHWSLLSDPRYVWNETEGRQVWNRAIRIRVAGEETWGLCPEDLLLYLAMHLAVHHGLAGLLWYWDLALLLGQWTDSLDWDAVTQRASRWRVGTALYFALLGCQRFFDVSAPGAVMARLRPRGPRARVLRRLVLDQEADRLKRLEHLIALLLVDRARDLIAPLTGALFPSPAWLRARYEGAGSSVLTHYLAHCRRMAAIAGVAVFGTPGTKLPRP